MAYGIGRMAEDVLGWEITGWKIAATNADMQRAMRVDSPIYCGVYAPNVRPSPVSVEQAKISSPIPEVENLVRLGPNLPPLGRANDVGEVTEAVAMLHLLNVVLSTSTSSRLCPPFLSMARRGGRSFAARPSRIGGSGKLLRRWQRLYGDGDRHRRGTAQGALYYPMAPLAWLASALSQTGDCKTLMARRFSETPPVATGLSLPQSDAVEWQRAAWWTAAPR